MATATPAHKINYGALYFVQNPRTKPHGVFYRSHCTMPTTRALITVEAEIPPELGKDVLGGHNDDNNDDRKVIHSNSLVAH